MTPDLDPPACLSGEKSLGDSDTVDNAGRVVAATAPVSENNSADPQEART